jgi:hypothetical protein
MNIETMTLEEIKQKLLEKKKKHNEVCKKSYRKRFLINKENLTEEEKQIQKEKIEKRRIYMNKRYKEIYKIKNQEKKNQEQSKL